MYMHIPSCFAFLYCIILQFYHVILRHYAYMRYYGILVDICVDHIISHSIRFTYICQFLLLIIMFINTARTVVISIIVENVDLGDVCPSQFPTISNVSDKTCHCIEK